MRDTVLLFDIDGTLLRSDGAGRRAFEEAFAIVCGGRGACAGISFAGMTDRAIARAGLAALQRRHDDAVVTALLDAYLTRLSAELSTARVDVMPGVVALLTELERRTGVALGVGTGNVRPGAEAKLSRVGLSGFFAFGGYGCDHEERARLLAIGAERGAARLGRGHHEVRVVVVGDTERDVLAARAIGAPCIGVATGGVACSALLRAGATFAFDDLAAPGVMDALFGAA